MILPDFKKKHIPLLAASIVLFLLSLIPVGFCVQNSNNCWPGWFLVPFGWMAMFGISADGLLPFLTWIANPILIIGWLLIVTRQKKFAVLSAAGALCLGLLFLGARSVMVSEAGGAGYKITSLGYGYWIWIASIIAAGFAALAIP